MKEQDRYWYKIDILNLILVVFVLTYLLYGIGGIMAKGGLAPDDFTMRYRESKYLLHGINPFDVMNGTSKVEPQIGELWAEGGAAPWALSMGIILNFTFLNEEVARGMAILLFAVTYVGIFLMVVSFVRKDKKISIREAVLIATGGIAVAGWGTGLAWLNYGTIYAALLIWIILYGESYPKICGVVLAIVSMKPQLAIPFYLCMLFRKKWKILSVACIIPIIFWGITCILSNTNFLYMLVQMKEVGENYWCNSIMSNFSLFTRTYFSNKVTDLMSITACIILTLWLSKRIKVTSKLFYIFPTVLGGMWMYTQEHDRTVLAAFIIIYLIMIVKSKTICKWDYLIVISSLIEPGIVSSFYEQLVPGASGTYQIWALYRIIILIVGLIRVSYSPNILCE